MISVLFFFFPILVNEGAEIDVQRLKNDKITEILNNVISDNESYLNR